MQALLAQFIAEIAKHIPEIATAVVGLVLLAVRWVQQRIAVEKVTTAIEVEAQDSKMSNPVKKREAMYRVRALHPLVRPLTEAGRSKAIDKSVPAAKKKARASLVPPAPIGRG